MSDVFKITLLVFSTLLLRAAFQLSFFCNVNDLVPYSCLILICHHLQMLESHIDNPAHFLVDSLLKQDLKKLSNRGGSRGAIAAP